MSHVVQKKKKSLARHLPLQEQKISKQNKIYTQKKVTYIWDSEVRYPADTAAIKTEILQHLLMIGYLTKGITSYIFKYIIATVCQQSTDAQKSMKVDVLEVSMNLNSMKVEVRS